MMANKFNPTANVGRNCLWLAVVIALAVGCALGLRTKVAPWPAQVSGRVVVLPADRPAPGATVRLFQDGALLSEAVSNAEGYFCLGLPAAAASSNLIVVAESRRPGAQDCATLVRLRNPASQLRLKLSPVGLARVYVTTTSGRPLAQARVAAWPGFSSAQVASVNLTGPDGIALLPGLSPDKERRIVAGKPGFADNFDMLTPSTNEHRVLENRGWISRRTPDTAALHIPLSRETIIEGQVLLDGAPVQGWTNWWVKMQGWCTTRWARRENWRLCYIEPNGHYLIRNVPSLAIIGEPTFGGNLDMQRTTQPAPGITAQYVPPHAGWDVMLTINRHGTTQYWICYVDCARQGLRYAEGEHVWHNYEFQPMALLKGVAPHARTIAYRDPHSIYGGGWKVTVTDGHFEVPVPTGDIELRVDGQPVPVTGLTAHETREVTLP